MPTRLQAMSLNYRTQSVFTNPERDEAVIAVYSKLTFYQVSLSNEGGTIIAPGLEHEFERDHTLSYEAEALCAVIRFESDNR